MPENDFHCANIVSILVVDFNFFIEMYDDSSYISLPWDVDIMLVNIME